MGNAKHDTMRDLTVDELENVGGGIQIVYCTQSISTGAMSCHTPSLTELWVNGDIW
jgi:hypothetical protein